MSVDAQRRPDPAEGLPANTPWAIRGFWLRYWLSFFLLLPWIVSRQIVVSLGNLVATLWTWNRSFEVYDGLKLAFMNSLKSLGASTVYGERFIAIHYRDVLIDPGPVFAAKRIVRYVDDHAPVEAIVATHAHEEHVGNASELAEHLSVAVHGTHLTLQTLRDPAPLSFPRRVLMGQPSAGKAATCALGDVVQTSRTSLQVIESPGHCEGHASLYDPEHRILFAGDSFLHVAFTSPNAEVSAAEWIETLERYRRLEIDTMVGTHGLLFSIDPRLRHHRFVTRRRSPQALIEAKIGFLRWARRRVEIAEARGLSYAVIEASLFPWSKPWSARNWCVDESVRLFSAGEFSRTHFLRSLTSTPHRVPPRFRWFARIAERCTRRPSTQNGERIGSKPIATTATANFSGIPSLRKSLKR